MMNFLRSLTAPFQPAQAIEDEHRSNFRHLYLDITWFGVLSGSTLTFLTIYAARIGASAFQIGLITAGPAIVNLIFGIPAGRWLEKGRIESRVFLTAIWSRAFYLLLVPLPILLSPQPQIWAIVIMILLSSIPGTALAIGFNTLFGEAVPARWRAYVAGIRNAAWSIVATIITLVCGEILELFHFPHGYQIVFGIGFFGAVWSCIHLASVRPKRSSVQVSTGQSVCQAEIEQNTTRRTLSRRGIEDLNKTIRFDILTGPFKITLALLFGFHFFQYLAIPIMPIYVVDVLLFSDQIYSLGMAVFSMATFLGSLALEKISHWLGNHKTTAIGVMLLCLYPAGLIFSQNLLIFMVTCTLGGFAWALAGGALFNYLLDKVPSGDMPAYLTWYNIILNAAILTGSLLGPAVGGIVGLTSALALFAIGRFLAGVFLYRFG